MSLRPLSQRHHDLPDPQETYEVRVWDETDQSDAHWRTLACCARRRDAELLAGALVSVDPAAFAFAEVWGPTGGDLNGRRHVLGRFPQPSREEMRDLWRRAVEQHYSAAYTDLKR